MRYLLLLLTLCTADAATIIARRGSPPLTSFPTTGLVSYWRLEEGYAEASAYDAHGSNDLTAINTPGAASTGVLGYCRDFEFSSAQSFEIADGSHTGLDFATGDLAFSVWFNVEAPLSGSRVVFSKWEYNTNDRQYALFVDSSGNLIWRISSDGTNGTYSTAQISTAVSTATWYCAQGYHDSTGNEIGVRINGGSWTTASATSGIYNSSVAKFCIGRMTPTPSAELFDGLIDDLALWTTIPSDAEFDYIYNSGSGNRLDYYVPTGNLLAHYPLDEASGNAADAHGSYTLTGTANITTDTQLGITGRDFSSTTDYLTNASVPASANMSVSGWIYHPFDLNDRYWFSNGAQAMGAASVEVGIRDTGSTIYPRIIVEDATDGTQFTNVSGSAWTPPAWRHIVVTRNAAGTEYRFFVNGVLGGIDGDSAGGLVTTSADGIALGDSADGTGSDWIGLISHVSVYSDEIDPGMVAELYGNGTPPEL